jgi:hypothetical protein
MEALVEVVRMRMVLGEGGGSRRSVIGIWVVLCRSRNRVRVYRMRPAWAVAGDATASPLVLLLEKSVVPIA